VNNKRIYHKFNNVNTEAIYIQTAGYEHTNCAYIYMLAIVHVYS